MVKLVEKSTCQQVQIAPRRGKGTREFEEPV